MVESPQHGELDLGLVWRRMIRRWPLVLGLSLGGAILAGVITAVMTPIYEARATLIFPASSQNMGLQSLGLQNTIGSQNMELVEGIVTSREVEDQIVSSLNIEREKVRENLSVSQLPARRQVILNYRSPSKEVGIQVIDGVLSHLLRVEESIGVNTSEKRLNGYREAFDEKAATVREIEEEILDFQKSARTVPIAEDGFTGMTYLKERSDLKKELEKVERQITERRNAAKRVGQAANSGLPTGLESETKWRDALLQASIELDQVRAKYQTGTPQVKAAEEKLETTRSNLIKEISKYVQSVQEGADAEMSGLLAQKIITQWLLGQAEDLAKIAPQEASTYRRLLDRLKVETQARDELKLQSDAEAVRSKVEAKIWQVLDQPYVDEDPINKKFGMNIGLGLILGGFIGAVITNGSARK